MSLRPELLTCLDHLGATVTVRTLNERRDAPHLVALRHDIDHDLDLALEVAHHEHARGMRASYYLLHTHEYWDDPLFADKCRQLAAYGHEVGLHLNALTGWFAHARDDVGAIVAAALERLRHAGVEVVGTSAHGDRVCYEQGFANDWIWREMRGDDPAARETGRTAEGVRVDDPAWQLTYPADHRLVRDDGAACPLWSESMARHGLAYDAYHVPHEHYWSDSGGGWTRTGDPQQADLGRGRHQVLIHPHWWRGAPRTIFALSTARAGSTWLAQFVNTATNAEGVHEWTLNHRRDGDAMVADKRTHDDFRTLEEQPAVAAALIRQMAAWRTTLPGDRVEANVYLEPFLDTLHAELPEATLVHLHRDGRDVVRSILNRGWYEVPDDRRHRTVPVPHWHGLSQFERACWYHRFTQERLLAATDRRLSFERMVADRVYLEATLAELGLVTHPLLAERVFDERVNANRREPLPPYAEWPESFRRTFESICGGVQATLGYGNEFDLPPAASPATTSSAAAGATVFTLDPAAMPAATTHVVATPDPGGLTLATAEAGRANAHAMLTPGKWDKVTRRQGIACTGDRYFAGRARLEAAPGVAARLFALFFDAAARQVDRRHVATLRDGTVSFTFRPTPEASHLALAAHLGDQSPERRLRLTALTLDAVPTSPAYGRLPVAEVARKR